MTTEQIIESLNRDRLIHIDVIEASRRGRAAVVYAASDALLLHTEDWLHLLVCDTVEAGVQALSHCDAPVGSIVAHSDAVAELVEEIRTQLPAFPGGRSGLGWLRAGLGDLDPYSR